MKIELKRYNYDKKETEIIGEVDTYDLKRSMSFSQFGAFMVDFLNSYSNEYEEGKAIGKFLHGQHRTLQSSVFRFLLGILVSLGDQQYTDARNEVAVASCKQIGEFVKNGLIKIGYMI